MVQRIGSLRRKTRQKFSKSVRRKGKISLTKYFQTFNEGDKVLLNAEPAVQKGLYHPRFHGKSGIIKKSQGRAYYIEIKDKSSTKQLLVHPVHLKRS
tara:strand:- start:287 stop:577 length:291 start_codon:yes stop_codon:yes gene_type:complete